MSRAILDSFVWGTISSLMCISERELTLGQSACPGLSHSIGCHLSLMSKGFKIEHPFLIADILAIISRPSISIIQKVPNVASEMAQHATCDFLSLLLLDPGCTPKLTILSQLQNFFCVP